MADIRIALTNLGKYNEGELVYTWLELPASDDEINEAFAKIGVADGTEYEEHFITDYEAPFRIEEYSSVETLNEIAEALESVDFPDMSCLDVEDVMRLASELESAGLIGDRHEYVGDIIHTDDITEYIQGLLEGGARWERLAFLLANTNMNDDYFLINGYANLEEITERTLENFVSDMLTEMRGNF